jgi:hypothetical protein
MTQEEKDLLLKDLCARLPYGIFVKENRHSLDDGPVIYTYDYHPCISNCKPYLRPLESMTEEERLELSMLTNDGFKFYLYTNEPIIMCSGKDYNYLNGLSILDWLNAHHFDYRGLIEKGLALKAKEGMYE